jgi:hypothetical protein
MISLGLIVAQCDQVPFLLKFMLAADTEVFFPLGRTVFSPPGKQG